MAVLFDTNILVSLLLDSDKYHQRALSVIKTINSNKFGNWNITDYVIDEVITVIWSKTKRKDQVETAFLRLTEPKSPFNIIFTSQISLGDIWEKWNRFAEYPKRPLSFTDASLLAVAEEYGIEHIASFDTEFNGLISVLQ